MRVCVTADRGAPQRPAVPDGGDGGPAAGPDAAARCHSAQTAASAHRVHRGEAAEQLDIHLPLWLPPGIANNFKCTLSARPVLQFKLFKCWVLDHLFVCLFVLPCAQETVGQHLFLIVSALTQQTAKGPVDCVTEKALYTLSEDWLLWQAQDFATLVLTFFFPP